MPCGDIAAAAVGEQRVSDDGTTDDYRDPH